MNAETHHGFSQTNFD